ISGAISGFVLLFALTASHVDAAATFKNLYTYISLGMSCIIILIITSEDDDKIDKTVPGSLAASALLALPGLYAIYSLIFF
ncbi:hypothetical protein ACO1MF_13615, partial [Staphylococcus aureus]